jgi:acetylornithine deacetylase
VATHAQRLERIARLVAQPSVSSTVPALDQSNRAVIDELADMLDRAGFEVELLPLPNAPNKANLIATLGKGAGGLVLAGHTDTVPFDAGAWTSDPFRLTERDGKLYGLGASDMKAFLAIALEAGEGLDGDSLRAPLIVLATADEETTMDGARALVQMQRPIGRYAIVGEPTDLRPVSAHKGVMFEQLRVVGESGHSSDPALGNNALDGMARVLVALMALRQELAARYRCELFSVPVPTMNFGRIHGGDNANRICGACELDFDVRLLPGMEIEAIRKLVRRAAEQALAGSGLGLEHVSMFEGTPAFEASPDSLLLRAAEELTGEGAQALGFGTEAPYFAALGADTIVLGPGGIEQAHRPDEYVRCDRLEPTATMLKALAERLCKAPPR